jgi:hypothetical protein
MQLAAKEGQENLTDPAPAYTDEEGKVDNSPVTGRGWEKIEAIPKIGTLTVTYTCAAKTRNAKLRTDLLMKYGFWPEEVVSGEVMLCAGLHEIKEEDVLRLVYALMAKFESLDAAFTALSETEGTGVGEPEPAEGERQWQSRIKEMISARLKGPDEAKRLQAVFRHLDPGGDGQISKAQFSVMEPVWAEIRRSIVEFLEFCSRTFGQGFQETWNALDSGRSGFVVAHDWVNALAKVGYFGPHKAVFDFVDEESNGAVGSDVFKRALGPFQVPPWDDAEGQ